MQKLYSIRIVRREDQVVSGVYIKEFWMFCGVYVRECIVECEEDLKDNQEVNYNIVLAENPSIQLPPAEYTINMKDIHSEEDLSSKQKRKEFGKRIQEELLSILTSLEWDLEEIKEFNHLYEVFVDSDYAYLDYVTHLFVEEFNKEERQEFFEGFETCINQIYLPEEFYKGLEYRKFAYLNCARKINRICKVSEQEKKFDDKKIMCGAYKLAVDNSDFSIGNVLAGLIAISRFELWQLGEKYMSDALAKEGKQKHSAFIYYALAHFYESDKNDIEKAYGLYGKMRELFPSNYRAIFKYACEDFYKDNERMSYRRFMKLYVMMKDKSNRGWIQPLELEYYYKCARILSNVIPDKALKSGIRTMERDVPYRIKTEAFLNSKFVKNFLINENSDESKYQVKFQRKMDRHRRMFKTLRKL